MQVNLAKLEKKTDVIISNYVNGNRTFAADKIRKLTKIEIVYFVLHLSYHNDLAECPIPIGHYDVNIGVNDHLVPMKGFIMGALEKQY